MEHRLIISFRGVNPDIVWCKKNKSFVRRLAENSKKVIRNISILSTAPVRKEVLWGFYHSITKRRLLRDNSEKVKLKDGFDLMEYGTLKFLEKEQNKFQDFLYASVADTYDKEAHNFPEKFKRIARGVKKKLYATTVNMYQRFGIMVYCRIEEVKGEKWKNKG